MDRPGAFAFKCKCCANPWQITGATQGSSDFSFCEPCVAKGENKGLDPANIDMTIKPQDDFYLYSNGGWKNNNPCPPQYPRWGVFNVLNEENQARLRSILEELEDAGKNAGAGCTAEESDFERDLLVRYHKAFMDEEGIEKAGIAPVVEGLETIQSMTAETFTEVIATLWTSYGHNSFFNFGSMPSMDDSSHTLLSFGQGGLGLPDRDYYFEAVHEDKREKYIMYLEELFKLLGEKGCTEGDDTSSNHGLKVGAPYNSAKKYRDAARAVFEFEKLLAAGHMTKIEARDPVKSWNKMDWGALEKTLRPTADDWSAYLTKGAVPPQGSYFNLREFFTRIGYEPSTLGDVNIRHIEAMRKAVKLASAANLATIKHYLTARHVASAMPYMSEDFFSVHFNYFSKEMSGVKEVKDRWKRALDAQMSHLPDCMGKLYVKKYFDESSKQKALAIVADVKEALRERLMEVDWMGDETRKEAIKKMNAFNCKIGYPDEGAWTDYTAIKNRISDSDAVANRHVSVAHSEKLDMDQCNKPTDRSKWLMPCQMINAYYHPMLNEIVFPAAILQAPFFDVEADDAVQFGSLGCIAGHEMTHGFDDKGRKYDSTGQLRDWWSGDDGAEYEKRAKVMIDQANNHMVFDQNLKGELTVGENIADLGGVKLALRALKKKIGDKAVEPINGFTPEQRFCLSWSQAWRQNATKEYQVMMVTVDPHGPSELRANNTLSNLVDFYTAFNVKEGDPMYRKAEDRVDIW